MNNYLIVFAKEPKEGKVKTRLLRSLSKVRCLGLYRAFVKDTLDLARKITSAEKILAYEAWGNQPRYLRRIAADFTFYRQSGRGLGQRMNNAFKVAHKSGAKKIIIIGSDAPNLPPKFLREAFAALKYQDVVIGPADDGGYYLIGLKEPCAELFKNVPWSSAQTLKNTLKNTTALKKKVIVLDKWYDVDSVESLSRLKADLRKLKSRNRAKWTKEYLKL